jgi:hypothetical protein
MKVATSFRLTPSILPLGHQSLCSRPYPSTVGKRGTVELSTAGPINILGLRFGTSAISSILPLVAWD